MDITSKAPVHEFISTLFFSRNQAHVFHLQTDSYAKHMALDSYYNEIIPLVDSLVESYQGTNGIIKLYSNNEKYAYGDNLIIGYFEDLLKFVKVSRDSVGTDSDLQNIVDEIVSLIKSTLYKLKNLK